MKFVSPIEAQDIASISQATLFNYLKKGILTRYKIKGRLVLDREEILALNKPKKILTRDK